LPRLATLRTTKTRARATGGVFASATLSGTITASVSESDIVSGGKTLIITLFNASWVASGGTFDAQRQAIIDGINGDDSDQLENGLAVTDVIRTSATVATITCSAIPSFDVASTATYVVVIPGAAVVGGTDIPAFGGFTVSANAGFTTPDIVNNASFESDFEKFTFNYFNPPSNCSRVSVAGDPCPSAGTTAVLFQLPIIGTGNPDDEFHAHFEAIYNDPFSPPSVVYGNHPCDQNWSRFYFKFDAVVNDNLKFMLYDAEGGGDLGGALGGPPPAATRRFARTPAVQSAQRKPLPVQRAVRAGSYFKPIKE